MVSRRSDGSRNALHCKCHLVRTVQADSNRHLISEFFRYSSGIGRVRPILTHHAVRLVACSRRPVISSICRIDHRCAGMTAAYLRTAFRKVKFDASCGRFHHMSLPVRAIIDYLFAAPCLAIVRRKFHHYTLVLHGLIKNIIILCIHSGGAVCIGAPERCYSHQPSVAEKVGSCICIVTIDNR